MSSMALTYIKPVGGTATFGPTRPLNGGGILVVDGNLVMDYSSASAYSGVIYVTGNYTQNSTCSVSGQVVVCGNVSVNSPSDVASLEYNPDLLNEVRRQLGQYRERRSGVRVSQDP
jgi:formylmethanofuran dehydrogenase subunit C